MVNGDKVSWGVSVRRILCQPQSVSFESLLSILANVFLCRDIDDSYLEARFFGVFFFVILLQ